MGCKLVNCTVIAQHDFLKGLKCTVQYIPDAEISGRMQNPNKSKVYLN